MDSVRGVVLLIAGCFAFYAGLRLRTGHSALYAYGLGVVAIAVGIWRLTRRPDRPRP
jgi:uncharacterized membrane protein HdeD (DUF308 family)